MRGFEKSHTRLFEVVHDLYLATFEIETIENTLIKTNIKTELVFFCDARTYVDRARQISRVHSRCTYPDQVIYHDGSCEMLSFFCIFTAAVKTKIMYPLQIYDYVTAGSTESKMPLIVTRLPLIGRSPTRSRVRIQPGSEPFFSFDFAHFYFATRSNPVATLSFVVSHTFELIYEVRKVRVTVTKQTLSGK